MGRAAKRRRNRSSQESSVNQGRQRHNQLKVTDFIRTDDENIDDSDNASDMEICVKNSQCLKQS